MMRRALLSIAALSLAAYSPVPAIPQTVAHEEPIIPMVLCPQSDGTYLGTAFRIGPHLLISVKHVTSIKNCWIDGQPIHIIYQSPKADFTILSDDRAGKWLKVDCGGFVAGRQYIAIGHPRGSDQLVAVPLVATGDYDDGFAILTGIFEVQPGHPGGAIIDAETHQVVGAINAADWEKGLSYSIELKHTPICKGDWA